MAPDELDDVKVLGRRWAREVASDEELQVALRAVDRGPAGLPSSARAYLAAATGPVSDDRAAAFLDGVATSEGEE